MIAYSFADTSSPVLIGVAGRLVPPNSSPGCWLRARSWPCSLQPPGDSHEARLATNPRALGSTRFPFSSEEAHSRPRRFSLASIDPLLASRSRGCAPAPPIGSRQPMPVPRRARPRSRGTRRARGCTRIPFGSRLPTRPVESSCLPLPPRRVLPVAGYPPAAPREAMIDGACRRACVTVGRG